MSLKLTERIEAFSRLGSIMKEACTANPADSHAIELRELAENQYHHNKWFTSDYVRESILSLSKSLNKQTLREWIRPYSLPVINTNSKRIAVVMAGNIPLVGFHDLLSVLISGNIIIAKPSSKDRDLTEYICSILVDIEPLFKDYIILSDKETDNADAVIATGSNNTSRYFEYNFGHLPHIFRKNRNSVAIIHPAVSDSDLRNLGKDIFYYYGLGCRNVSRLYLPVNFDFSRFASAWKEYAAHLEVMPYRNNYNYNRALLSVEEVDYTDLGFLLLKQEHAYSSPVSVLYYSFYNNPGEVSSELAINRDMIQAIVGKDHVPFGQAQYPALNDYADGIDTLDFLRSL